MSPRTYLSSLVHLVVGELDLLKGDDLLPQLLPSKRGVGVGIETVRRGRISLAGNEPGGSVVGVAVALVVAGDNVEEDPVLHVGVQVLEAAPDRGEHAAVGENK